MQNQFEEKELKHTKSNYLKKLLGLDFENKSATGALFVILLYANIFIFIRVYLSFDDGAGEKLFGGMILGHVVVASFILLIAVFIIEKISLLFKK